MVFVAYCHIYISFAHMYCIFFVQLGKYQVKDMNVYIEPLVDDLLKLWNGVTMYDVSRPIGKRQFQFHAMLA